jgi:hypothetical protein
MLRVGQSDRESRHLYSLVLSHSAIADHGADVVR